VQKYVFFYGGFKLDSDTRQSKAAIISGSLLASFHDLISSTSSTRSTTKLFINAPTWDSLQSDQYLDYLANMVHKVLFWAGFGMTVVHRELSPVSLTVVYSRRCCTILAARDRNAPSFQQRFSLGLASICKHRRRIWILASGRGGTTGQSSG
jgi:hypothetical protein